MCYAETSNHHHIKLVSLWSALYRRDVILFRTALSMIRYSWSTVWKPVWGHLSFLSFHKWYIQLWNAILSRILSMIWSEFTLTNCNVLVQSGSVRAPLSLFVTLSQTVKEYGHAKNTWSQVSSISTHNTHDCWTPQALILSPVESRFRTANHTINEKRGTACENHTVLLQNTVAFRFLICSQVFKEEKQDLLSFSEWRHSTISLPWQSRGTCPACMRS